MQKKNLFKLITFSLVLFFVILLDYTIGFVADTNFIINSAKQFRGEASYLSVKTRILLPNVNHTYQQDYSDSNQKSSRLFRTSSKGEILGDKDIGNNYDYKIVFLGGSTTECNEINEPYRFPFLVGKKLNNLSKEKIVGINIGVRGNTVHDSVNLLFNHPTIKDAKLVVLMHNINDRLFLSYNGEYETVIRKNPPLSWDRFVSNASKTVNSFFDYITFHSNLLLMIRSHIFSYNPWTGDTLDRTKSDEDEITFQNDLQSKAIKTFKRNLTIFVSITKAMEKTPILMTQVLGVPSKSQDIYNQIIREVAQNESIFLIDLAKLLNTKTQGLFLSDNIHMNDEGSKIVSEIISSEIATKILKLNTVSTVNNHKSILDKIGLCKSPPKKRLLIDDFTPNSPSLLIPNAGRYPVISKDNKYMLYQSWVSDKEVVSLVNLMTGKQKKLTPLNGEISDRHAIFVENKDKLFILMARRVSKKTPEFLVISDVEKPYKFTNINLSENISTSIPEFNSGKVYFAGSKLFNNREIEAPNLYELNLDSLLIKKLTSTKYEEWRPSPSPDGKYIYYIQNSEGNFGIYKHNLLTGTTSKFYSSPADEWDPNISSDSEWIVFASKEKGTWNLILASTKTGERVELTNDTNDNWDPRFFKSNAVIFAASANNREPHIYYQCLFGKK